MIESNWGTRLRYGKAVSRLVVRHQQLEPDPVRGVHSRCSDPEVATNDIAGFAESQSVISKRQNHPRHQVFINQRFNVGVRKA
jgi:hypothetical protein